MNESTAALRCLKCGGAMRTYERNGITIDQCEECRGIFLDRGELERLIAAESAALEPGPGTRHTEEEPGGRYDGRDRHGRKRRGFLGEFFD